MALTTNDPIADMLTRIRNANTAKHDTVDVPASKMKTCYCEHSGRRGLHCRNMIFVEDGALQDYPHHPEVR